MSYASLKTLRPFFTNKCGRLLAGGKVYTYEAGTLIPKATYKDAAGLTENTNPIVLDASGEADIYINSDYRFQIFDRDGVLIDDIDLVAATQRISSAFLIDESGLTQSQINNEVRLDQAGVLTPTASWPDIPSLVNQSGAPSIHDMPVQALLNRIQKLYEDAVLLSGAVENRYTKTEADNLFIENSEKGVASGVATLDSNVKIPDAQQYEASTTQKGITQLINDLTTGGTSKALTAEQGKLLFGMFTGGNNYFRIPNPSDPAKPWLIQCLTSGSVPSGSSQTLSYPVTFPNSVMQVFASLSGGIPNQSYTPGLSSTNSQITVGHFASVGAAAAYFILAIGK